jgi:hypothetical protein
MLLNLFIESEKMYVSKIREKLWMKGAGKLFWSTSFAPFRLNSVSPAQIEFSGKSRSLQNDIHPRMSTIR